MATPEEQAVARMCLPCGLRENAGTCSLAEVTSQGQQERVMAGTCSDAIKTINEHTMLTGRVVINGMWYWTNKAGETPSHD